MPRYYDGMVGAWKLTGCPFYIEFGYFTGPWAVVDMPALQRQSPTHPGGWETWMSLSPHEIESQEPGARHARGHIVIMGLGMGWIAANAALNPATEKITVVERDPEVIDLLARSGALDDLPEAVRVKIEVVQADALDYRLQLPVDLLYADIWRELDEPQTFAQVRRMQSNVGANEIYVWGQEIPMQRGWEQAGRPEPLREWARDYFGLPLLIPEDVDYPAMIEAVALGAGVDGVGGEAAGVMFRYKSGSNRQGKPGVGVDSRLRCPLSARRPP